MKDGSAATTSYPFSFHIMIEINDILTFFSRVFWSDIGTLMIAYSYMNGDGFEIIATETEAYGLALDYLGKY